MMNQCRSLSLLSIRDYLSKSFTEKTLKPTFLYGINLSYTKRYAFRFNGNYTSAIADVPRKHKNSQEVVWLLC